MVENLDRPVFLIANKNCKDSKYPFETLGRLPIENDCVNWYEKNKDMLLKTLEIVAKKYNNELFFISAGPLSEILIHNLYKHNPNNSYVDVGSSLDIYTHNKNTREYQDVSSHLSSKKCNF